MLEEKFMFAEDMLTCPICSEYYGPYHLPVTVCSDDHCMCHVCAYTIKETQCPFCRKLRIFKPVKNRRLMNHLSDIIEKNGENGKQPIWTAEDDLPLKTLNLMEWVRHKGEVPSKLNLKHSDKMWEEVLQTEKKLIDCYNSNKLSLELKETVDATIIGFDWNIATGKNMVPINIDIIAEHLGVKYNMVQLYRFAQNLNITGRSSMKKQNLTEHIARALGQFMSEEDGNDLINLIYRYEGDIGLCIANGIKGNEL